MPSNYLYLYSGILMGGHAKCLRLMTRGEGGGSKIPKTRLRNTWMFPYDKNMYK